MPCCKMARIKDLKITDIPTKIRNHKKHEDKTEEEWLNQIQAANKNKNNVPICKEISTRGDMCNWFHTNKRCGQHFPVDKSHFMFIPESFTYSSSYKINRDRCIEKPAEERQQTAFTDYYGYDEYG